MARPSNVAELRPSAGANRHAGGVISAAHRRKDAKTHTGAHLCRPLTKPPCGAYLDFTWPVQGSRITGRDCPIEPVITVSSSTERVIE